MFVDIEDKDDEGEVEVYSDQCATPMHTTSWYYINGILEDGYEVDDDQHPEPNKNHAPEVIMTDQYTKTDGSRR